MASNPIFDVKPFGTNVSAVFYRGAIVTLWNMDFWNEAPFQAHRPKIDPTTEQ